MTVDPGTPGIEVVPNEGKGDKGGDGNEIPKELPAEVKLEKADVRSLQYIIEKEKRIEAEADRVACEKTEMLREKSEIIGEIQQKYRIDLKLYEIRTQESVARRRIPT